MALYVSSIHGAERLDAVDGIAQRHGYRCKRPHHGLFRGDAPLRCGQRRHDGKNAARP